MEQAGASQRKTPGLQAPPIDTRMDENEISAPHL